MVKYYAEKKELLSVSEWTANFVCLHTLPCYLVSHSTFGLASSCSGHTHSSHKGQGKGKIQLICFLLFSTSLTSCTVVSGVKEALYKLKMKAVRFSSADLGSLYINEGEQVPEPDQNEVRIKVFATAINRADTIQRRGRYNPPPGATDILGLEAAGIIDKLGPGCPDSLAVGQRVMSLLSGGGNAEFVVANSALVMPIPAHLSMVKAAAIPEVWLTAFQLLHFIGKVSPSDTVLVHAGASGVGTAAVQLVKQVGAKAIVSAGSQEKIDFAVSLGASAGVNYKEGSLADKVMAITEGQGVNLILDPVGASMFDDNMKMITMDGRWILYGLMGGTQANLDMGKILGKRITLTGTTLRSRSLEYRGRLIKEFSSLALPLFETGTFQPVIDRVLPFSEIKEAHTLMEGNKNKGKIVLELQKEESGTDKQEL